MDKGRMEFAISFLEPGGNSAKSGKVQIFVYINSNCIFLKPIEEINPNCVFPGLFEKTPNGEGSN